MKRFFAAVAILLILLGLNVWIMFDLRHNSTQLLETLDSMKQTMEAEDYDGLEEGLEAFADEWAQAEHRMSRYIRHNYLETITAVVARLPGLARYGAYQDIYADLNQVQALLVHLVEFEAPPIFGSLDNKGHTERPPA